MGIWSNVLYFILLIAIGICGIWKVGGKKLMARWLFFAALAVMPAGLVLYILSQVLFSRIAFPESLIIYVFMLPLILLLVYEIFIIHRFYARKWGFSSEGDEFTARLIRNFQRVGLGSKAVTLIGIALLALSAGLFTFWWAFCIVNLICIPIVIFLIVPLGILMISLGFIWQKDRAYEKK